MPVIFPMSLRGCTLWRYMSLEKLLAVLQTSSLYFSRLNSFTDPYEGSVPVAWRSAVDDATQLPDLTGHERSAELVNRHSDPPVEGFISCPLKIAESLPHQDKDKKRSSRSK